MHVLHINKKLLIGFIILISFSLIVFTIWSILPDSRIQNRLDNNKIKIDKQEYQALLSNLKQIYAKSKIKYVNVTLSGNTGDKELMAFWRPNKANPSGYIDGCYLGNKEKDLTNKKPEFYIDLDQYHQYSKDINRDLNYCIGLLFLNKPNDISQIESIQKYLDLSGGTKNILLYIK